MVLVGVGWAGCGPSGSVDPVVASADAPLDVAGPSLERLDVAAAELPPPPPDAPVEVLLPPETGPDVDAAVPADAGIDLVADAAPASSDAGSPAADAAEDLPLGGAGGDAGLEVSVTPEAPGPWLQVSLAPAQPLTDLTAAGNLDWAHFGQGGVTRVNRKLGVVPARITMNTLGEGTVYGYDNRPIRFAWTDGTPTGQVSTTAAGISVGESPGRGFEIRAEGDVTRARVLRVHVGVWGARAHLWTRLNDDESVPAFTDNSLSAAQSGQDRVYTIRFRPANQGQQLLVRWTLETATQSYGNVTLQAASLSD